VSVTSGTIFHDTRTPLTVWFEAAWHMTTPKNGVSATTLANLLPLGSYQTAWTMLAKYRAAIHAAPRERLSGTVEVDEWFQGGVANGGNCLTGKNLVIAAVEVGPGGKCWGRVRFAIIANRSTAALRKFIWANVEPGSRVITDALNAYDGATAGYKHEARNESAPDAGQAHTLLPAVHRVFSLAERWLLGTHQGGVQREHLIEYLDEFAFRWNRRNCHERGLPFMRLLQTAIGAKPVAYRDLVRIGATTTSHPVAPAIRRLPGSLDLPDVDRPWRQSTIAA